MWRIEEMKGNWFVLTFFPLNYIIFSKIWQFTSLSCTKLLAFNLVWIPEAFHFLELSYCWCNLWAHSIFLSPIATEKHQMVYDENSGKVSLMIKSIGPGDEGMFLNYYFYTHMSVHIHKGALNNHVDKIG